MTKQQDKTFQVAKNMAILQMSDSMMDFSKGMEQLASNFKQSMQNLTKAKEQIMPKLSNDLGQIKDIKDDLTKQMDEQKTDIYHHLTNDVCNECINIIQKYDVGLPKLDRELDEVEIAAYLSLIKKKDKSMLALWNGLLEWQVKNTTNTSQTSNNLDSDEDTGNDINEISASFNGLVRIELYAEGKKAIISDSNDIYVLKAMVQYQLESIKLAKCINPKKAIFICTDNNDSSEDNGKSNKINKNNEKKMDTEKKIEATYCDECFNVLGKSFKMRSEMRDMFEYAFKNK